MLTIGLTGGIGSGKSTVADLFRKKGAHIIDFDKLAHQVEEPQGSAWKGIVDHFGREVLKEDGTIDREKLGNIVFRDPAQRRTLNGIVHPAVFEEWMRQTKAIVEAHAGALIISDIPLLIEIGLQHHLDITILVYVSPEEQIERIMRRNGYNRQEAEDRLNSQMPIDEKVPHCDIVINNEGNLEETERIVDDLWEYLLETQRETEQPKDS